MCGFRFNQRQLISDVLLAECSGLLGAPTRYGKTTLIINTLRAFPGVCTVVTVPGSDLLGQLYEDIKAQLPHREVKMLGGKSKNKYPCDDITVCSMDSLHKCETGRVRLMLLDEPHACAAQSRSAEIAKFDMARKIGFGATVNGRFDGRDDLIEGMIGPLLAERTYLEALAEGAVCRLAILVLKIRFAPQPCRDRDHAYRKYLWLNEGMADIARFICREMLPSDWQTILFIKNEKQAELYLDAIKPEGTIAMAKRLKESERKDLLKMMEDDIVKRCLATDIYSQGVTFHDIKAIINLGGGGGSISCVQKPGRLAEIRPGKNVGVVFDFLFESEIPADDIYGAKSTERWNSLVVDSWARINTYKKKGYEIYIVDTPDALVSKFHELVD
jgi:superfamily II DNA or RNA helicase